MQSYFVYLLSSRPNGTLYCGVTNNLVHRIWQHRNGQGSDFTSKYNVTMLVWFEEHGDIRAAIHRETQIKRWRREWKLKLIEGLNPQWRDLHDDLLPGAARVHDKPPVVDHTRANPSRFAADDPFLHSFDVSERLSPPVSFPPQPRSGGEREPRGRIHRPRSPRLPARTLARASGMTP